MLIPRSFLGDKHIIRGAFIMKRCMTLIITIVLCFNLSNSIIARAEISVGGSSQEEYQTTGSCAHGDRTSCEILVNNFITQITNIEYNAAYKKFNYKDTSAWEKDLKPGQSYSNIDDVSFMIFSGHGYGKGLHGIANNSLHYYTLNSSSSYHASGDTGEKNTSANLTTAEARWGKTGTSTKWVALFSCNFLNTSDSQYNQMMQGIHTCMGFGSVMWVDSRQGTMLGAELRIGRNIIDAFLDGATIYQSGKCDKDVIAKVIYASKSRSDVVFTYSSKPNPIGSGETYYSITRTIPSK